MRLNEISHKIAKPVALKQREPLVYIERSVVSVVNNQVCAINKKGRESIPVASVACILLGPGTSITNEAVKITARRDCCVIWSGGGGIPIHCFSGNYKSPRNLLRQIRLFADEERRLEAAKKMLLERNKYTEEFDPKICKKQVVASKSLKELLLIEARWAKMFYAKNNMNNIRDVVKLTNFMCYGLVTPYIISMGYNPNLGIIHGENRGGGLIFDIADLIKPECSVKVANKAAGIGASEGEIKAMVIEEFKSRKYYKKIIKTIGDICG